MPISIRTFKPGRDGFFCNNLKQGAVISDEAYPINRNQSNRTSPYRELLRFDQAIIENAGGIPDFSIDCRFACGSACKGRGTAEQSCSFHYRLLFILRTGCSAIRSMETVSDSGDGLGVANLNVLDLGE
ncbi:hypothetical protein D3C71_1647970 [compost metagenome]